LALLFVFSRYGTISLLFSLESPACCPWDTKVSSLAKHAGEQSLILQQHQAVAAPIVEKCALTCQNLTIPVSVAGSNYVIPPTFTLDPAKIVNQILDVILTFVVQTTTYNLQATYCEPAVNNPARANTLQILVHTLTYTEHIN